MIGAERARARATSAYRNDHFLNYQKDKTRLQLRGRDVVEGRAAHVVDVISAAGGERKVFFDAATYLILKEQQDREGLVEEILFGDYRPVDGVLEPHRIRVRRGAETWDLAVQTVVHNGSVDSALFEVPRLSSDVLPEFETLFKAVIENQKALEKAKEDYTYTKVQTEIETDGSGRLKDSQERTYQVFSLSGKEIERLVAKNDKKFNVDTSSQITIPRSQ